MDSSNSDSSSDSTDINELAATHNSQVWEINSLRSLHPPENKNNGNDGESDSEDDLENPNNLKKMCGGFLDKIKEKTDTINMYKRMVINSNLQLVQMESAYQRKMRIYLTKSKTLSQDKLKNNSLSEVERDPLTLFPEEVWTILLSQVTEVKDLLSLSRTCSLFQRILNKSKNEWLFVNVFPYLFNYLPRKDVLQCRFVCKQWLSSVDNFIENYKTLKTYFPAPKPGNMEDNLQNPNVIFKPFRFEYGFFVPFTQHLQGDSSSDDDNDESSNDSIYVPSTSPVVFRPKNKFLEDMRLHSSERNPFIGRSVSIQEASDILMEGEHILEQFVPHSKSILEDFGQHIWHLSITCLSGLHAPLELWRVLNCGLEKCENLKSLRISGNLREISLQGSTSVCEHPVDRPSLETIRIDTNNKCVTHLQNMLVSKFSGQLKRFEVQVWREDMYDSLDWGNLRELRIHRGNCMVIMKSLMKTDKMGNLRKLTIPIGLNGNGNTLEGLVELTRKFTKLSDLVLKFEDQMGGTSLKNICEESLSPGVVGSNNLITLEIHSASYELVSYDFLVSFPYLSSLTIKHCHRRLRMPYRGQGSSREINRQIKITDGKGILNFAKYIAEQDDETKFKHDLSRKIYGKANIWEYLPFLRTFTVYNGSLSEKYKKVFRRHVYEYFRFKKGDK